MQTSSLERQGRAAPCLNCGSELPTSEELCLVCGWSRPAALAKRRAIQERGYEGAEPPPRYGRFECWRMAFLGFLTFAVWLLFAIALVANGASAVFRLIEWFIPGTLIGLAGLVGGVLALWDALRGRRCWSGGRERHAPVAGVPRQGRPE